MSALRPNYDPRYYCNRDPLLQRAIDLINEGLFNPERPDFFHPLTNLLLNSDHYLVLADFDAYCRRQNDLDELYRNQDAWSRKAILNVARMGKFSSDRAISEYNQDIWRADTVNVTAENRR